MQSAKDPVHAIIFQAEVISRAVLIHNEAAFCQLVQSSGEHRTNMTTCVKMIYAYRKFEPKPSCALRSVSSLPCVCHVILKVLLIQVYSVEPLNLWLVFAKRQRLRSADTGCAFFGCADLRTTITLQACACRYWFSPRNRKELSRSGIRVCFFPCMGIEARLYLTQSSMVRARSFSNRHCLSETLPVSPFTVI